MTGFLTHTGILENPETPLNRAKNGLLFSQGVEFVQQSPPPPERLPENDYFEFACRWPEWVKILATKKMGPGTNGTR